MSFSFEAFNRESELLQQRELFSECFPENRGLPSETVGFYRRKFTALPATPPSYEYVARDEKGLAGYYAALPYTYNVNGESFRCGMVCDVMTAPRLRGKGVFTSLGRYALADLQRVGVDFVTGFPRREAVIPGHLKVGWRIEFELPLFMLPLRCDALFGSRHFGFAAPLGNLGLAALHSLWSLARRSSRYYHTEILDWRTYLSRYNHDSLLKKWQKGRRNSLVKDANYLRWRLSIQPLDYHVVTVNEGMELVGISILRRCDPEGVPSLGILDVMYVGDPKRVLGAMIPAWRCLAEQLKAEVLLTMMSGHTADALGAPSLGFLRTPVTFKLITKSLSNRAKEHLDSREQEWDLMWIDSDDL